MAGPPARIASTQVGHGWIPSPAGGFVRIYWTVDHVNYWVCSGTLLTRGIVLTAGHCVYANPLDEGPKVGFTGYFNTANYVIVPGNAWSNGQSLAPYGAWSVKNMWTTDDYRYNGVGGDWGIIELNQNAQGQYPGDVGIGTYSATWSQQFPSGSELYLAGYPASGAFSQTQFGGGNIQYYCDDLWTPDNYTAASFGTYYAINVDPCQMNGGASGGPVFVHLSNGSWTIIGVNNRGNNTPNETDPNRIGKNLMSFWFDDRFGAFWTDVISQVNAGY